MSKSRRKHPVIYYENEKEGKKYINRKIRRNKNADFATPGAYKRVSQLNRWKKYWSKRKAIEQWYRQERLQQQYSLEEWIEYWEKCAIRNK